MGFFDILALATVEVYGDFAFKRQANSPTHRWDHFANGLLGQAGVIFFLIRSLRGETILYVNGMWDALSNLIESIAAQVILGERLQHVTNYVGLLLVVVGIVLLKH